MALSQNRGQTAADQVPGIRNTQLEEFFNSVSHEQPMKSHWGEELVKTESGLSTSILRAFPQNARMIVALSGYPGHTVVSASPLPVGPRMNLASYPIREVKDAYHSSLWR